MNDLTEPVLGYLRQGLHLLALSGKRPNTRFHGDGWSWDNSIHGYPETEGDMQDLLSMFDNPRTTGVAILIPENVLVADIDTEEAAELYMSLAGGLPDTWVSKTPNGLHVWFMSPGADGSRWIGGRTLLFKGFGGYVAAPPSQHFTDDSLTEQDGVYAWVTGPDRSGIDWLPDPIAKQMRTEAAVAAGVRAVSGPSPRSLVPEIAEGRWTGRGWGKIDLEGLQGAIENAKDGNQNNVIHWAACVARDDGVPLEAAMKELMKAALAGHHPEERARSAIRSAYRGARE